MNFEADNIVSMAFLLHRFIPRPIIGIYTYVQRLLNKMTSSDL